MRKKNSSAQQGQCKKIFSRVGGGSAVCTSLQYARVFTYKIIVFENSPNHEIYVKNNENLELGYEKSV